MADRKTSAPLDSSAAPAEGGAIAATVSLRDADARGRLAAIVESSVDAIVGKDLNGIVHSWNRSAERLFGYSAAEMIGRSITTIIPADRQDEERMILGRIGRGELIESYETVRLRKDGSPVPVSLTISPVRDESGRVVGASKIARDITERRQMEEALARQRRLYEAILTNTPDLAFVLDLNHRFIYANEGLLRMWGRTREEAIGRNCLELGYEPWHAALAGTTRDVTDLKAIEESLREADRRKDEFLATLAHELRNPLAPIRHAAALSKMPGVTAAQLKWSGELIERQVGHMARLLDDLLDVSRITRGRLELRKQRVELGTVIEDAVETARPLIDSRHHELAVEIPRERIPLHADRVRLVQIVGNLLNNAAKYTDPGGRIELHASIADGQVLIAVRDTGIGIEPQMLPRVFDMFSQEKPALERAEGGLGIGLALARGLVALHGGAIEARSGGRGQGSEFIVRLPLDAPVAQHAAAAQTAEPEAPAHSSGLRILVVDDSVDTAESLAVVLRFDGHEVRSAHGGRAALDAVAEFRPHIAVLDIGMPEVNGYQVAERIRAQPRDDHIVLIALTGWGQESDRQRAIAAGFDHHITKPLDLEHLRSLIARSGTARPWRVSSRQNGSTAYESPGIAK